MKRFSPKSTLSNFKTRVRETVEFMNMNLFAIAACAVFVGGLFISTNGFSEGLSFTAPESADDTIKKMKAIDDARKAACDRTSSSYDEVSCAYYKSKSGVNDDARTRLCEKADDIVQKAAKEAKGSCRDAGYGGLERCYDLVTACNNADTAIDEMNEEDEGSTGEYCNKILANSCPSIPNLNMDRDYRQEKKDAEADRKDAKKELDGLLDDQKQSRKALADKQRELQEAQQNAALAAHDEDRKIAQSMKKALADMAASQKKAFEAAQAQYEEMEVATINMRQEAIAASDAVTNAEEQLQTTCRAAAEKRYADAEKARLAALAARKKNLGASTSVSGSARRLRSATARARNIDYTSYLSECTSGASAEGMSAINAISQAKRAKAAKDKLLADKSALLDKKRAEVANKLKSMEADASAEQARLIEDVNQEKASLEEKRALTAQQNQTRMIAFQQEQAAEMQSLQQKIDTANQELMKTQQEASLATSRIACLGKNAQRSESLREKASRGFSSALSDIDSLADACRGKTRACSGLALNVSETDKKEIASYGKGAGDTCDTVKRINAGTDSSGKKRSTFNKSFEVESSAARRSKSGPSIR